MDARNVYPTNWFLNWRNCSPVFGCSRFYEYVRRCRHVYAAHGSTVWPSSLVTCALFNTLHSQSYAGTGTRQGITRERFFGYAFAGAVVWCKLTSIYTQPLIALLTDTSDFIPGYLFQALRYVEFERRLGSS